MLQTPHARLPVRAKDRGKAFSKVKCGWHYFAMAMPHGGCGRQIPHRAAIVAGAAAMRAERPFPMKKKGQFKTFAGPTTDTLFSRFSIMSIG